MTEKDAERTRGESTPDLKAKTLDQLVAYFIETAVAEEQAIFDGTTDLDDPAFEPAVERGQALYWELARIDAELRSRGREARLGLTELYEYPNMQVKLRAAHYTLGVALENARAVLQWFADVDYPSQGWQARSILTALDHGKYKLD